MTCERHSWVHGLIGRIALAWIAGGVIGCARLYPAPALSTLPSRILPPPVAVETIDVDDEAESADAEGPVGKITYSAKFACMDDPGKVWTLAEAIEFGLNNNPRLRAAAEAIAMAQGGKQAAFAPFLPSAVSSIKYVASASEVPGFSGTFVPYVIGLGPGVQEFDMAEMQVQWTLWDFGRSLGRYEQAAERVDVARLRSERARQTIAFDVAVAYLHLLYTQAVQRVERQAIVQAEAILRDARDAFEGGVIDKDGVLRAELQLAEAKQKNIASDTAEQTAVAALNLAMGRNVSSAATVLAIDWEPNLQLTLGDGLQLAVDNRREIEAARRTIVIAQRGHQAAQGEFLPRVFVRGVLAHVDGQGIDVGNVQIGGIHVEQGLYEGGRRSGEAKSAKAAVRAAEAQAQVVCDNIAFEVNQAYRAIAEARQRIELSKSSVAFAEENVRIVVDKYKTGDRTPTDVVDAQTTLTRASQSRWTAMFDYQASLVRLEYAAGVQIGSLSGLARPTDCVVETNGAESSEPAQTVAPREKRTQTEPIAQEEMQP
jgi:outer membrane protein TolC